jgi:hypothetical protein
MGDAAQMMLQDTRPNITVSAAAVAPEVERGFSPRLKSPSRSYTALPKAGAKAKPQRPTNARAEGTSPKFPAKSLVNKTRYLFPARKVPIYPIRLAKIETA